MGVKCQRLINVIDIRALIVFQVLSVTFRYKCSYLIKYLLTELDRSVRRVFCPLSLYSHRAKYSSVQNSRSIIIRLYYFSVVRHTINSYAQLVVVHLQHTVINFSSLLFSSLITAWQNHCDF